MNKREAHDYANMLDRLSAVGIGYEDAMKLRRISMTLRRWFELECGDSNNFGSWAIERDGDEPDSKPFHVYYSHRDSKTHRAAIPDRENGARKRLEFIMSKYPTLAYYVQTDPRGAALYILRPGDVRDGANPSTCYTNGICVY